VDYVKLLEMDFFTYHMFLEVGKTQDLPNKIWQTVGAALTVPPFAKNRRSWSANKLYQTG
jgi:hypothetical protein